MPDNKDSRMSLVSFRSFCLLLGLGVGFCCIDSTDSGLFVAFL